MALGRLASTLRRVTLVMIAGMMSFRLEPVAVFMVGVALALQINYPDLRMQRERIDAHAKATLMMAGRFHRDHARVRHAGRHGEGCRRARAAVRVSG